LLQEVRLGGTMGSTPPTRVDDEVYESAKVVGALLSRSTAQQISHWARIGRELEASQSVSFRDIADVLGARRPYDDLTVHEQAVVRAEWTQRIDDVIRGLDFSAEFTDQGRSWVELDEEGNVVVRGEPATAKPTR